jgi:hypothetical protein
MKGAVILNKKEIEALNYPVMVEMRGRVGYGLHRRRFMVEFTDSEIRYAKTLFDRFEQWHLVTGSPDEFLITRDKLTLTKRLIHFFGTI